MCGAPSEQQYVLNPHVVQVRVKLLAHHWVDKGLVAIQYACNTINYLLVNP